MLNFAATGVVAFSTPRAQHDTAMKRMKHLILTLWILIPLVLIAATIMERWHGTPMVAQHIYGAPWFVALWALWAVAGMAYVVRRRLHRRPFTFLLHCALVLILAGAFTTWQWGSRGKVQLRQGKSVSGYLTDEGSVQHFPFNVVLDTFVVATYAGTDTPQDYISRITITDDATGYKQRADISMNRICTHRGYRLYQSGYDADGKGSTLRVSHDPWGIGLTYAGYALLLLSMMGFFLDKRSMFRRLLQQWKHGAAVIILLGTCTPTLAKGADSPKVLPRDIATEMGQLFVSHNGRICPLQTAARDFTLKLCGSTEYQGATAEQVLTGWMFYYDTWKNLPMLRIKNQAAREVLGIEGKYATLRDFVSQQGVYKLEAASTHLSSTQPGAERHLLEAHELFSLVSRLCRGEWLKLFPIITGSDSVGNWYAWADPLPSDIDDAEAVFVRRLMDYMAEQVAQQNWDEVRHIIAQLKKYQVKQMGQSLPDEQTVRAELLYNRWGNTRPLAYICLLIGLPAFGLVCRSMVLRRRIRRRWTMGLSLFAALGLLYLTFTLALRSMVSGHLPFSNGYETMQLMAFCSLLFTLPFMRRFPLAGAVGVLTCGLTLLVAGMGQSQPQITPLMPVLHSPLLSWHVVVIMAAYVLLAFVMLISLAALIIHCTRRDAGEVVMRMQAFGHVMLVPAVFLLAIGIFIGAVWANISWGRYWGWDPKETWALITLLVYALPLHAGSYSAFRRPTVFHLYCVVAFLSVLMTYFGVNYLLGGMHSYAG